MRQYWISSDYQFVTRWLKSGGGGSGGLGSGVGEGVGGCAGGEWLGKGRRREEDFDKVKWNIEKCIKGERGWIVRFSKELEEERGERRNDISEKAGRLRYKVKD